MLKFGDEVQMTNGEFVIILDEAETDSYNAIKAWNPISKQVMDFDKLGVGSYAGEGQPSLVLKDRFAAGATLCTEGTVWVHYGDNCWIAKGFERLAPWRFSDGYITNGFNSFKVIRD